MKASLRALFSPLLNPLERGDEPYVYKPLNRKILLAVSLLFSLLCAALVYLIPAEADQAYLVPVVVFGLVALVGFIVGLLGNDRAVAEIWGNGQARCCSTAQSRHLSPQAKNPGLISVSLRLYTKASSQPPEVASALSTAPPAASNTAWAAAVSHSEVGARRG